MPEPTTSQTATPAHRQAPEQAQAPKPTTSTYLGPAKVLEQQGHDVLVQLDAAAQQQVTATPALTFPYEPVAGDTLLVLGQEGRHYIVGVIAASRPQALAFQGDVDVRAVDGKLTLASDQAVELNAPRITLRAGILRTIASSVVEKADSLRRWVRGLIVVRAGQSRRIVDGEDSTRCENSTTLAKDTVKIDGDQLHLGH